MFSHLHNFFLKKCPNMHILSSDLLTPSGAWWCIQVHLVHPEIHTQSTFRVVKSLNFINWIELHKPLKLFNQKLYKIIWQYLFLFVSWLILITKIKQMGIFTKVLHLSARPTGGSQGHRDRNMERLERRRPRYALDRRSSAHHLHDRSRRFHRLVHALMQTFSVSLKANLFHACCGVFLSSRFLSKLTQLAGLYGLYRRPPPACATTRFLLSFVWVMSSIFNFVSQADWNVHSVWSLIKERWQALTRRWRWIGNEQFILRGV